MLNNFFFLVIILKTVFIFSQKKESSFLLSSFFWDIHNLNIPKAINDLKKNDDKKLYNKLEVYLELKHINGFKEHKFKEYIESLNIESKEGNLFRLIDLLIISENEILYTNNRGKAFDVSYKGFLLANKLGNKILQREFLDQILRIYRGGVVNNDDNVHNYLNRLYNLTDSNKVYLFKYYLHKIYLNEMGLLKGSSLTDYKKTRLISNNSIRKIDSISAFFENDSRLNIEYYHIKGLNFIAEEEYKRAHTFFLKGNLLLEKENNVFFNKYKYENLKEISRNYSEQMKYKDALHNLKKIKKYESTLKSLRNDFVYNLYASDVYFGIGESDSAFYAMKKAFHNSLALNFKNQNNLISGLEIKNKTKEKEIENLKLKQENLTSEAKRKQNQNLFYGALTILFFGIIIYYQNIKNSKRKRLLAEKQEELEKQKNISLIKEQEITTINAMVNGQEKERIRIAEDLHDNIGSVLATLKLHFENLKLNREKKHFNQEELYLKTEKLIDETYFKVRSLAHAKNSGVIANKGLLTAVKIMAEKISDANKIAIEVLDFGLEKHLENSFELTVFRIVQELTTNIIKHAAATHATINLSLYDNNLNIIIEDNGKGFVLKEEELKNGGMGLGSIKTRIKHLNGTFDVDSTLNKGTSILINIPV